MRIGVIGTGNMGRALGVRWALGGHEVLFGAREAQKAEAAAELAGNLGQAGTNDQAAAFAEVIVWNPRIADPREVLQDPSLLDGKILVDMQNGPVPADLLFPPITTSFSARLAAAAPQARVVKAFNTLAQEVFEQTAEVIHASGIAAFIASDDLQAKQVVAELARELGFEPVDCGPLNSALQLEAMGDLIRLLMIGHGHSLFSSFALRETPAADTQRLGGRQASKLP
jgi:8-hydroxy-5-deazaflavin:NADPH oxidoreductase